MPRFADSACLRPDRAGKLLGMTGCALVADLTGETPRAEVRARQRR